MSDTPEPTCYQNCPKCGYNYGRLYDKALSDEEVATATDDMLNQESIVLEFKDQMFDHGGLALAAGKYRITRIEAGVAHTWKPVARHPGHYGPWYIVASHISFMKLLERHDGHPVHGIG